ncbi:MULTISPECIES: putative toxin-antitoxin system toxin component, PIN family [Thermodesulfovibrio]|uniref:putative toxin-antitoxin system toxin component, PIN family n=1 Tax=Thermodesulfovibrio TaxID=28261 RepID=UPI00261FCFCB|nr:putative toxin-antitoxin system toxin component, PIN family [Thermodesulfovibrio sp.]
MKVVFDTNVYISAFVINGSLAEKAILKILRENYSLFISKEIIDEILSVFAKKFSYDREYLSRTALFLSEIAEVVQPTEKIDILKDKGDNKIIECAVAARADVIVSGDKELLSLGEHKDIKIITLREFLQINFEFILTL